MFKKKNPKSSCDFSNVYIFFFKRLDVSRQTFV